MLLLPTLAAMRMTFVLLEVAMFVSTNAAPITVKMGFAQVIVVAPALIFAQVCIMMNLLCAHLVSRIKGISPTVHVITSGVAPAIVIVPTLYKFVASVALPLAIMALVKIPR